MKNLGAQDTFFHPKTTLNCRGRLVSIDRPVVMGILNLTPDSFYDGGRYNSFDHAVQRAEQILEEGGTMIDLGAYSSRPGASNISEDEERQRLLPPLEAIRERFPEAILSVDTFRSGVAREAIAAGGDLINDISAGSLDPELMPTVAQLGVPYVLMHMQGTPQTMQENPTYTDAVAEIIRFLADRAAHARSLGMADIIVDPGFGFGKKLEHNMALMRHLDQLQVLGLPVLVGVSRKSMFRHLLGISPDQSLNATTVMHTLALERGARILRTHDVRAASEAVRIVGYPENR